MAIDHRLIKALHVETLRRQDLHAEREPHVLFQASTFSRSLSRITTAVSFAELRDHGDLGLGTFDAVDGEMIAVDGEFFRAVRRHRPPGRAVAQTRSPSSPSSSPHSIELPDRLDDEKFIAALDQELGDPAVAHPLRIDGRFDQVHAARSRASMATTHR